MSRVDSMLDRVKVRLSQSGEDHFTCAGRTFALYLHREESTLEVDEVLSGGNKECLFVVHEEDPSARIESLRPWVEWLCVEEARMPSNFLLTYTIDGVAQSRLCPLAEIALVIGFDDFNETDNHRVYCLQSGVPEEVEWQKDYQAHHVTFGEYGSYWWPEH